MKEHIYKGDEEPLLTLMILIIAAVPRISCARVYELVHSYGFPHRSIEK